LNGRLPPWDFRLPCPEGWVWDLAHDSPKLLHWPVPAVYSLFDVLRAAGWVDPPSESRGEDASYRGLARIRPLAAPTPRIFIGVERALLIPQIFYFIHAYFYPDTDCIERYAIAFRHDRELADAALALFQTDEGTTQVYYFLRAHGVE
jgi:hypothetical protein